jgi:N-acetylmuramoyl-L-alanine amidase
MKIWRRLSLAIAASARTACPRLRPLIGAAAILVIGQSLISSSLGKPPDPSACNRNRFRIVLDIGHSIDAPGASSARGVPEYQFNLLLAQQVERTLIDRGFPATVLLNTFGPARASLFERVARANVLKADLFLSIHHDSVPQFLKEEWELDGQPHRFSDRFRGHSLFVSARNRHHAASLTFARMLGLELKARGLAYTSHYIQHIMGPWARKLVDANAGVYRYDQLVVLSTTNMPAVLLEAGSIVHREEELLLASTERQVLIAASVSDAVEHFCVLRSHRHQRRRIS